MQPSILSIHPARLRQACFLAAVLTWRLAAQSSDGVILSVTDGQVPPALAAGGPSTQWAINEMESISPLTGTVGFSVPLLKVGGRGEAGYTIYQRIFQPPWRIEMSDASITWCGGSNECRMWTNAPTNNSWNPEDAGFTPGTVIVRYAGGNPQACPQDTSSTVLYQESFVHVVFTSGDGAEHKLYDLNNIGMSTLNCANLSDPQWGISPDRGTVFEARDGSGIVFVADSHIYDNRYPDQVAAMNGFSFATGTLKFPNGVNYKIDNLGRVISIVDRNGNTVTLQYATSAFASPLDLTQITDAIGRVITINYSGNTSTIAYKGFNGASRQIQVKWAGDDSILRSDFITPSPRPAIFPDMVNPLPYTPSGVSSIGLPNNTAFRFYYNNYNELARVVLPTGGAIEYDFRGGLVSGYDSGQVGADFTNTYGGGSADCGDYPSPGTCPIPHTDPPYKMFVYRRLVTRRLYDGTALQSTTTYSRPETSLSNKPINVQFSNPVVVETTALNGARLSAT